MQSVKNPYLFIPTYYFLVKRIGATDETRTHTTFLTAELKSDASANFATVADCYDTTLKMLTKPNLKQRLVLP